jgi:hypothetical protein
VPHAVAAAERLLERGPIEAVISTSPPLASHFAALALKLRFGLKWIADFRDPLAGNPGRPRRWAAPYDALLEHAMFHSADRIVAVTDTVAEGWKHKYPRWESKIHVIWNGFDPEDVPRAEHIPHRGYRELAHVGVLYSQRHPYRLTTTLDRLIRHGQIDPKSIRLRFVGPIQERERFENDPACAALLQQGSMAIEGELIPRAEANQIIATSDFLLLIDIVNLSRAGYTVPAKLYDYIVVGRPILAITDRHSPVERILVQSGVPQVCLYHDDPEPELDHKLLHFLSLSSDPVSPSSWFLENFDGRRQGENLARLVTKL